MSDELNLLFGWKIIWRIYPSAELQPDLFGKATNNDYKQPHEYSCLITEYYF